MSGSIGYAIRVAKGSLSLDRLRQQYPDGPPDSLKARARDIGWSEACGWPREVLRDAPLADPMAYLFDVPEWVFEDWVDYEVLEFVAGCVKTSRLRAQWRAGRLSRRLGRDDIPLLLSIAIGMVVSEVDEFVRAAVNARLTLPERLSPGDLLRLTLPAAVEARGLGMPVGAFAGYVHVSCGRTPVGALTAGVPAEYAAVL